MAGPPGSTGSSAPRTSRFRATSATAAASTRHLRPPDRGGAGEGDRQAGRRSERRGHHPGDICLTTLERMSLTADLGPGSRATRSTRWRPAELDVLVVGGGRGRGRRGPRRGLARAVHRPGRAARLRQRHRRRARASWCTAACATWRCSTSRWSARRCEERGLLLTRLAPHLVRPVPFLYPLHHTWERPYVGAGLLLYDAHGDGRAEYDMGVPRHKHLFRRQLARIAPDLRTDELTGAIRYYDCQVDDARLVMTHRPHRGGVRRPRRHRGPRSPASCARATGWSACARRDLENDRELEVRARVVVNAGGVWTNEIQDMLGGRGALDVEASKGIHLVVPRDRIRCECRVHHQDRDVGAVRDPVGPALDHRHHRHPVGPRPGPPGGVARRHRLRARPRQHAAARRRSTTTTSRACTPGCGRCSIRRVRAARREISREHTVVTPVPGLVMIAGGKLTTYRVMARDAVDAAAHSLAATRTSRRDRITDRVPAARRRRLRDPHQPAGRAGPPRRPARRPHRPPARPVRRPGRRAARADRRAARAGRAARAAPRTTSPPRSCTPSPTRAPATSTTCSPGVPGSRSRPSTAASAPPAPPPR